MLSKCTNNNKPSTLRGFSCFLFKFYIEMITYDNTTSLDFLKNEQHLPEKRKLRKELISFVYWKVNNNKYNAKSYFI